MPVASTICDIRDTLVSGVDARWAESVLVKFFQGAGGKTDPDRPAMTIKAVLRVGTADETGFAGGRSRSWRTRIAAGRAQLHIDRRAHPDLDVREGDAVRAVARTGQPWFEVAGVDERGSPRLVLMLNESS